VTPDAKYLRSFATSKALETWLRANHARAPELWLKVHKKDSGLKSVTCAEALDVMLCWGWIDELRKGLDEKSFLQRYTPRKARSIWSQINRENVARLTKAALAFRTNNMKTPEGRARKIETLVAMLARGETIVPQKTSKKASK